MGAGAAAGRAGLCDGLHLHRPAAVRGPGADGAARGLRLEARRLLVPRRAQHRRRGGDVLAGALPVCLPDGAHRLPGAWRRHVGGGTLAGADALAGLFACQPADGAPGHRRRRGPSADGDAGRLRHGELLRGADLHHRHLPRLVLAGRPGGRGPAGPGAAGLRDRGAGVRAAQPRRPALCRNQPAARRLGAHPAGGRPRAAGLVCLRAAAGRRLPAARRPAADHGADRR